MIAGLLNAAALAGTQPAMSAPVLWPPPMQMSGPGIDGYFSWAQVVRVSPRPPFGSGAVRVTTDFEVQTSDGERHQMNMVYFGEDQFIPPVGSLCQIAFRPGGLRADFGLDLPNAVEWVVCDTGGDAGPAATE